MTDPIFEQLKQRIKGNERALQHVGDVFTAAVDKSYRNHIKQIGDGAINIDNLEQQLISDGIYIRQISLDDGEWYKVMTGKILAFTKEDDIPVVLFPKFNTYAFCNPNTNAIVELGKKGEKFSDYLKPEAFTMSFPLPSNSLTLKDIDKLALKSLNKSEITFLFVACLGVVILSMITPYINKIIFSEVIPSCDSSQLIPVATMLITAAIGLIIIQGTRSFVVFRLKDKIEYEIQNALMIRIMNSASDFFKAYSPGDLSARILSISTFSSELTDDLICAVLSFLMSGILGIQLFIFGGKLLWISVALLSIYAILTFLSFRCTMIARRSTIGHVAKSQGLLFNIFSGIQKVKTCGAEIRIFSKWADEFSKSLYLATDNGMAISKYQSITCMFQNIITMIIMIAAYYAHLTLSDYIAFLAVLGVAFVTLKDMNNVISVIGESAPILKLANPILQAESEEERQNIIVNHVSGEIQINGLQFHYPGTEHNIFNELSLHINAGEYVALVGKSGCGKSTLLRLLLGFETPDEGSIFFDHYNLQDVNKSSLRRNCISTCLQDGQIIDGTIMENISLTNPNASEEDVWEAARMAALDKDIQHMKDGMQTLLGEGGKSVSGGQRQRILLARSFICHPSILLLDEATSALDNISQKIVSDNFNKMGCTRITIAHRLSTIRECDRIIVINGGKVVEDGSFNDLLASGGLFAKLCERQM